MSDPAEGGAAGTFRFTRSGSTAAALTASVGFGGTATRGSDYPSPPASVTFGPGVSTVNLSVPATDDAVYDPTETVMAMVVAAAGYTVGSPSTATLTIVDNDPIPVVTVARVADGAEGGPNGVFRFTRTGSTVAPLTVNYSVPAIGPDMATPNTDYQPLSGTIAFPVGVGSVDLSVAVVNDATPEPTEEVRVSVSSRPGYAPGTPATASILLADNDPAASPMAGRVWQDVNYNRTPETADPGVGGAVVEGAATWDFAAASAITAADGKYVLSEPPGGFLYHRVTLPGGLVFTIVRGVVTSVSAPLPETPADVLPAALSGPPASGFTYPGEHEAVVRELNRWWQNLGADRRAALAEWWKSASPVARQELLDGLNSMPSPTQRDEFLKSKAGVPLPVPPAPVPDPEVAPAPRPVAGTGTLDDLESWETDAAREQAERDARGDALLRAFRDDRDRRGAAAAAWELEAGGLANARQRSLLNPWVYFGTGDSVPLDPTSREANLRELASRARDTTNFELVDGMPVAITDAGRAREAAWADAQKWAGMAPLDKLGAALNVAIDKGLITGQIASDLREMTKPENLALMGTFAAGGLGAAFVGGAPAAIAGGIGYLLLGKLAVEVSNELYMGIAEAMGARSQADIDHAAGRLATGIGKLTVEGGTTGLGVAATKLAGGVVGAVRSRKPSQGPDGKIEVVPDPAAGTPVPIPAGAPKSPEHKAMRWQEYLDTFKTGGKREGKTPASYEEWSSRWYEKNMDRMARSVAGVNDYRAKHAPWAEPGEVYLTPAEMPLGIPPRHFDIASRRDLRAIEFKEFQGGLRDVAHTLTDWRKEIVADKALKAERGWDIKWVFKGYRDISKGLKALLNDAKIPYEIIP
ncbi:MAG: hypothetical protein K2X87_12120 [Gemmataceae bacterium]|nr:hypothetical protein [Gemmataceae bacterium]